MGINLKAHSNGKLQDFKSLLNQFEAEGISDIRFIRQRIENHLTGEFREMRQMAPRKNRPKRESVKVSPVCPQCGSQRWRPNQDVDGEMYVLCKDCQYSELLSKEI